MTAASAGSPAAAGRAVRRRRRGPAPVAARSRRAGLGGAAPRSRLRRAGEPVVPAAGDALPVVVQHRGGAAARRQARRRRRRGGAARDRAAPRELPHHVHRDRRHRAPGRLRGDDRRRRHHGPRVRHRPRGRRAAPRAGRRRGAVRPRPRALAPRAPAPARAAPARAGRRDGSHRGGRDVAGHPLARALGALPRVLGRRAVAAAAAATVRRVRRGPAPLAHDAGVRPAARLLDPSPRGRGGLRSADGSPAPARAELPRRPGPPRRPGAARGELAGLLRAGRGLALRCIAGGPRCRACPLLGPAGHRSDGPDGRPAAVRRRGRGRVLRQHGRAADGGAGQRRLRRARPSRQRGDHGRRVPAGRPLRQGRRGAAARSQPERRSPRRGSRSASFRVTRRARRWSLPGVAATYGEVPSTAAPSSTSA